jgi:glycosyltransferase involved in cell wall biosynthesis
MNILVLHSSSDLYGASKILLQTVDLLSNKGNKVIVVLSEEGPLASAIREKGILIYIIRLGILRRKYFTLKGFVNRIFTIKKAKKEITNIVRKHDIEIIYSNTTGVLVGALAANANKIRHIWHIHEIITHPKWFLKSLGWIVNKSSNRVIVVSNAVKKHWQQYIDEDKIRVIYNGLVYDNYLIADGRSVREELSVTSEDVLIGMIGRVHYWKGQNYFLNIIKHISNKYPSAKFVMVGDVYPGYEYLYDELESTKSKLGIHNQVVDLGYRKDIPQILSALDIFVLPSILPDPLPTVVLEAMAASKPVVATAHGGALEMVQNGSTGLFIPWDDAYKAAEIISELIENKQMRKSMGQNGKERVITLFSDKAYNKKIEELF